MRHKALLLIGPTGAGKTPLGEHLERAGFLGRACCHFDFGENLRRAARGDISGLTSGALSVIEEVLARGALLEEDTFFVAEEILVRFLAERHVRSNDLLILNGLPRHVGQAERLAEAVQVQAVIYLDCSAETVRERLAGNTGGDRTTRTDDEETLVKKKLADFVARTAPLVDYYQAHGARIYRVRVGPNSQAIDMAQALREASKDPS